MLALSGLRTQNYAVSSIMMCGWEGQALASAARAHPRATCCARDGNRRERDMLPVVHDVGRGEFGWENRYLPLGFVGDENYVHCTRK